MILLLIVTNLSGETEALTDFQGLEVNEEINGDFSIRFTSLYTDKNAHSYPLLQEESLVDLEGQEFRVKRLNESRNRKSIEAQHVFFDLIDHRVYEINGGTKTLEEFFTIALSGTGWTFENVDVDYSRLIPNFGEDNSLSLIRQICNVFECEVKIEPNKHLKIYKEIGTDNDVQFRYKHNIKTLRKNVDTSKLSTVIKGYGGNGLEVTYTSPNYSLYGERHAEPFRDEKYTIAESLTDRLKQEITDIPEISLELEVIQLDFEAELGDKVWTIYEPMNIEFQQRVMTMRKFPFSNKTPIVTLSNKKATLTDSLSQTKIEVKENQKETSSKICQTNDRITLEVETLNESIAAVDIKADEIILSVEEVENSVAAVNIRADNITLSVQSLDSRVGSAESSISVQAGLISSKVSYGDVVSAIEQSPESIKISASKIELNGITKVNQEIQLGDDYSTGMKAIKFNGYDTWIYSSGDGIAIDTLGDLQIIASGVDFTNAGYITGLYAVFG